MIIISNPTSQLKVTIDSQLAVAFKATCKAADVSMVDVLSEYISKFAAKELKKPSSDPLARNRQRRAAVEKAVSQLQLIHDVEETYRDKQHTAKPAIIRRI